MLGEAVRWWVHVSSKGALLGSFFPLLFFHSSSSPFVPFFSFFRHRISIPWFNLDIICDGPSIGIGPSVCVFGCCCLFFVPVDGGAVRWGASAAGSRRGGWPGRVPAVLSAQAGGVDAQRGLV
jgi:hypothetical protein